MKLMINSENKRDKNENNIKMKGNNDVRVNDRVRRRRRRKDR